MDYGYGMSPILQLNIHCARSQNSLSDCFKTELVNSTLCRKVAGVDCIGGYSIVCMTSLHVSVFSTAPCVTNSLINCSQCNGSCDNYRYLSDIGCSCNSDDCFLNGDCCSDITLTENCSGNIVFMVQSSKYNTYQCITRY